MSARIAPDLITVGAATVRMSLAPSTGPHAFVARQMVVALQPAAPTLLASVGRCLPHAMSAESLVWGGASASALLHYKPEASPVALFSRVRAGIADVGEGLSELSPQKTALLGAVSNVVLSVLKLVVGLLAGSASLIADAGHSCSDLIVDGVCMLAVNAPVLERVCTAAIACLLASAGVACVWNGLAAFLASSFAAEAAMGPWPFVVALFACAGKEALYRVTAAVGVKRRSAILIASAKHHRSDAITSVAAALGSGGVLLGFPAADALAAAVVGAIIIKMSVEIGFGVAH